MADTTNDDTIFATKVAEAVNSLNRLIDAGAKEGLRTDLNITTLNRVGSPPLHLLNAEVSRAFSPRPIFVVEDNEETPNG